MKTQTLVAALVSTLFLTTLLAFANDDHHPEKAATVPAKPTKETVKSMQDNVRKMQKQLDSIAKAKTEEERDKLLADHMATMRENMTMAKDMMGGEMHYPMMKKGMMEGGMGHGDTGCPDKCMDGAMKDGGGKPMPGMDKQ